MSGGVFLRRIRAGEVKERSDIHQSCAAESSWVPFLDWEIASCRTRQYALAQILLLICSVPLWSAQRRGERPERATRAPVRCTAWLSVGMLWDKRLGIHYPARTAGSGAARDSQAVTSTCQLAGANGITPRAVSSR